ncbi:MAG: apolipoprotein N-acyltransferase [Bryobacteraceae bacterium]
MRVKMLSRNSAKNVSASPAAGLPRRGRPAARLALSAATAVLLILCFPRFDLAWLAPVALAPLLIGAALERAPWRRFLNGWMAGVIYWAGVCYWIQGVLAEHAGMAAWAAWLAFCLFCAYKALHMAFFACLAGPLMTRRWAALGVPALWVAIESTHGGLGFSWLNLGSAGIDMPLLAPLAPFTGVWGISFVFAMLATGAALLALGRRRRELAPLLVLPLLALLPKLPAPEPGTQVAVLVQPNVSAEAFWSAEWASAMRERIVTLTLEQATAGAGERPALIVWPEMPMPLYYYQDPGFRDEVNGLARRTAAYLILNVTPRNAAGAPLNSALLVSPQGAPAGRYDKVNLVPFGEYVPRLFQALVEKVSSEAGDFAPGQRQRVLPAGEHKIGAFICYESVFPDYVRRFAMLGADLFVNISNDGWYGRSAARDQHLRIVRMRAAENRRWILRATNDGITSTIDPAGRLRRNLPSYVAGAARTSFSYLSATTFYSRHGDWFVWVCIVLAAAGLAEALPRRSPVGRAVLPARDGHVPQ